MISLGALATLACTQEEIVFDHEKPAFDTRDGLVLIEAIMPKSTAADDEIYICGAFNGGESAIGQVDYKLEKSELVNGKWALYLDPAQYAPETSLEDGFWFYSKRDRREVTMKGEEAIHKIAGKAGERYTLYVDRWESYFDAPALPIPSHPDSYRLWYISDNPWDPVNVYMYGDVNDLGAGWPGIATGGTATLGDNLWAYIDVPKSDAQGKTEHLIFNGNGGKVQIPGEMEPVITFGDKNDYFFAITSDADGNFICYEVEDIENPGLTLFIPSTPVVSIYVQNFTEWEAVYAYSVNNDEIPAEEAFGAWPGVAPVDTTTILDTEYLRFEFEEQYVGHFANLIFSNGGSTEEGTLKSAGGPGLNLAADMKIALSGSSYAAIEDEKPYVMSIYVIDETGWDNLNLYAWGDAEVFGGWPGASPAAVMSWNGVTYKKFEFLSTSAGLNENLIFNNGNGTQLADFNVNLEDELFIKITTEGASLSEKAELPAYIYIYNNTGWEDIAVYAYGDVELFGGWPGAKPEGIVDVNGFTFTAFKFGDSNVGKSVNLIFNNNGGGIQVADFPITLEKENFLNVTAEGVSALDFNPRDITWVDFYVKDESGWGDLAVYAWGDAEMFGGWPGARSIGTATFRGVEYKKFHFSDEYLGLEEHFIINNGVGGDGGQFDVADVVKVSEGMFFKVTTEGATAIDNPGNSRLYVEDKTGWGELYCYAWGDAEVWGGWPGIKAEGTETIDGVEYKYFSIPSEHNGISIHPIVNNGVGGDGGQFDIPDTIVVGNDCFYVATTEGVSKK